MPYRIVLKYLSSKTNFRLQSNNVHTFQTEICRDDTFKLLLKTLLKELFTSKGEILSCKSVKPCKNRKNSWEFYARIRDKSGSNSPPFQGNVQIPPSQHNAQSNARGLPGGWMFKLQFHRYIILLGEVYMISGIIEAEVSAMYISASETLIILVITKISSNNIILLYIVVTICLLIGQEPTANCGN